MNRHQSTSPSRYYERQTYAKAPIVLEQTNTVPDYELFAMILGAAVWGFIAGMVVVAGMAGVL